MRSRSKKSTARRRQPSTLRGFLLGVVITLICVGAAWWTFTPQDIRNQQIESVRELLNRQFELTRERIPAPGSEDGVTYTWSDDSTYIFAGIPQPTTFPHPVTLLENEGFAVGYCEYKRNPVWVGYRIEHVRDARAPPRPSRFRIDERSSSRVSHNDYTNTGFDRGHLAPNHAIGSRYGREAQLQTFLMTNISPQSPTLNQQTWRLLEERIAKDYSERYGEVWVMIGPVFNPPSERLPSGVAIPVAFWKVIVVIENDSPKAVSFIIPQTVAGQEPFEQFLTSIAEIQRITGFDLFWELEDDFEEAFEAGVALGLW